MNKKFHTHLNKFRNLFKELSWNSLLKKSDEMLKAIGKTTGA